MDDIGKMKKHNILKLASFLVVIGIFFAGCSFKAEIDSRLVAGSSYGGGSAYTPVLDGCANESR